MKRIIPKQKTAIFSNGIDDLLLQTKKWTSEINFIKIEQHFLEEILSEHILGLCETNNFQKAKLLLNGISHEIKLGDELINDIKDHSINLALLIENIYLKREDNFRNHQEHLKSEVNNYIDNFKYLKEQIFELVLFIMKKEKEKKLLVKQ